MTTLHKKMTLKYSFVHGTYWMVFGATYNFVTVYLLSKNFTSQNIGIIVALTNIFSTLLQPYVAGMADRSKKLSLREFTSIMLFISLTLSGLLLIAPETMLITALLYFFLLTVMLTIQPLLNAMGMELINKNITVNFGVARGMGSLSYALMSYVLGAAVEQQGPSILPYAFIALFGATFFFTYTFTLPKALDKVNKESLARKANQEDSKDNSPSTNLSTFRFISKYKKFSLYLLGIILIFICFHIINIYMIKIVENVGGNEGTMGTAFAIAAVLELPIMLNYTRLSKKFHNGPLLKISGLFFTIKALITFIAPSITFIYIAQSFQMVSYALFVPGSIYYVNQVIKESDLIKGQAFTTAAMTLGGVGGSLIGGFLLTQGSLQLMLIVGTIISALGTLLFFFAIDQK